MAYEMKYGVRVALLFFYCSYALSPIYLSTQHVRGDEFTECGSASNSVSIGIVWMEVLLSSVVGGGWASGQPEPLEMKADEQGRDFILIKKKRAVLRDPSQIKPHLEKTGDISVSTDTEAFPEYAGETRRHPYFRKAHFCRSLHAGLSPPTLST